MTREQRAVDIEIICDKCGCNEKQRKRHFSAFVERNWQPHASLRFKNWWFKQQQFKDSQRMSEDGALYEGIDPVIAQNVERIWNDYLEAKQIGAA